MIWSQFSIKILGVHFGNFVLTNFNWDKIRHSLVKKQYLEQSATPFQMKKKNCKSNSLIQTLVYRSNIYYAKIKELGKRIAQLPVLVMWQGII